MRDIYLTERAVREPGEFELARITRGSQLSGLDYKERKRKVMQINSTETPKS